MASVSFSGVGRTGSSRSEQTAFQTAVTKETQLFRADHLSACASAALTQASCSAFRETWMQRRLG